MALENNFEYTQAEMLNVINDLEASRNQAAETIETIKSELKDQLLTAGMSGTTADALLATFEKEVVQSAEDYLATADHFIKQNKNVQATMDENSNKNVNIAQM